MEKLPPHTRNSKIKSDSFQIPYRKDVIYQYNRFLSVPDMLEQNVPVLSQVVYR